MKKHTIQVVTTTFENYEVDAECWEQALDMAKAGMLGDVGRLLTTRSKTTMQVNGHSRTATVSHDC